MGGGPGRGPELWGPSGGAPKGWAAKGPEGWRRPKISFFFPSPPQYSFFLPSLWGLFVKFWWCFEALVPEMCTFGVFELSCETPGAKFWAVRGLGCCGRGLGCPGGGLFGGLGEVRGRAVRGSPARFLEGGLGQGGPGEKQKGRTEKKKNTKETTEIPNIKTPILVTQNVRNTNSGQVGSKMVLVKDGLAKLGFGQSWFGQSWPWPSMEASQYCQNHQCVGVQFVSLLQGTKTDNRAKRDVFRTYRPTIHNTSRHFNEFIVQKEEPQSKPPCERRVLLFFSLVFHVGVSQFKIYIW